MILILNLDMSIFRTDLESSQTSIITLKYCSLEISNFFLIVLPNSIFPTLRIDILDDQNKFSYTCII